jgi:hypothetical protein
VIDLQQVRAAATDLKIRARICGLKRLAADTTALYAELIAHNTPPEVARGYFIINWMRETQRGTGAREVKPPLTLLRFRASLIVQAKRRMYVAPRASDQPHIADPTRKGDSSCPSTTPSP